MSDPRWTNEAEALVAKAAYVDWTGHERDGLPTADNLLSALTRDRWGHIARAVLAALADAGLLVEPGGETTTDYAVRWPSGYIDAQFRSREAAEAAENAIRERYDEPTGQLICRTVTRWKPTHYRTPGARYFRPWREVES